jgi:membrane protein required for colicin V production
MLINWAGRLLEKLVKWVLLDWLNKLGGILLFVIFYLSIYSIILFYGTKTPFIGEQAIKESHFYPLIAPFGPAVIRFITGFIPYGQDMFSALDGFFNKIAGDIH